MTPTLLNNRYRVLQTLGSGGFGNTFLAEDTYMPSKRRCVIKQLKPVTHDPKAYEVVKERFQREAAVLEELGEGHKQIPQLYAYFSENGQFYLVQEWIQGDTLGKIVEKRGALPENEVRQILVSLLPVLDYVHNRHIVHRDIKPDNIIMRQQDGLPVLIDFGAVKEAMNTVVNAPNQSAHSMVIGTPGFMPSEQAAGRPTYSSDLYSLGLTAVFLLTGKFPQDLTTDPRTGEILWRQFAPNLHSNLASVLERAIRFNPRDRFASANDMLNALTEDTASQMATIAVSPGGVPPARTPAPPPKIPPTPPQTIPVGATPAQSGKGYKPLIIGAAIAGGLLAVVAIAVGLNRSPERSDPVVSDAEPTTQQPSSATPLPEPTIAQQPPRRPTIAEPPRQEERPSDTSQAPPSPLPPNSPSPPLAQSPSEPLQFPSPEQGQRNQNRNNNQNQLPSEVAGKIPAFAPGTQRTYVEEVLGTPTKTTSGRWGNTRAVTYEEFIPGQASLGYLFDRNSGRLRQSEVSFYPSVDQDTMAATLSQMLSGNLSPDIQQGLESVYQRQSNRYTFTSGRNNRLKGVIERNASDRIYVGVWEADLH